MNKPKTLFFLCLLGLSFVSCTEYWWTRGQPPGTEDLLVRAEAALEQSMNSARAERAELNKLSKEIKDSLIAGGNALRQGKGAEIALSLNRTALLFVELDPLLSMGSRAPYGELSSQLRRLIADAPNEHSALQLALPMFTARTFWFLAAELELPPPAKG